MNMSVNTNYHLSPDRLIMDFTKVEINNSTIYDLYRTKLKNKE
jgi:hypothetical protein